MIPLILAIESPDDREFMGNLYEKYNRLMYSESIKIMKDPWTTEDVMQIAVIKLINKIPLLRTLDKEKLVNYIITTCRNTAYNYIRDHKRITELEFEYNETDGVHYDENPLEERVILNDTLRNVKKAWDMLDDRSRELLEKRYILDKSTEEIAEEMGIKRGSVRMALSRARNNLKDKMKKLK